jgi:dTDP-L-rhamnose 4-epimerase
VRSVHHVAPFVGALNVGSGVATSVYTVAEEIKAFFGSESPIRVSGAFRIGDIRHNIADVRQVEEVLGFRATVPFRQGLSNFLGWASEQDPEDKAAYERSVKELAARGLMGATAGA